MPRKSPKIGSQMDAIWDRVELASDQKGVPGGVKKKQLKALRLVLRGLGGVPGEGNPLQAWRVWSSRLRVEGILSTAHGLMAARF